MSDKKISQFPTLTSIPPDSSFSFISGSTNYKILDTDFYNSLNVTGSIVQKGDPFGVPILNAVGSVNEIKNFEAGAGIQASVSVLGGLSVAHNFTFDASGVPLTNNSAASSPVVKSLVAGSGITLQSTDTTITVSTGGTQTVASFLELRSDVTSKVLADTELLVITGENDAPFEAASQAVADTYPGSFKIRDGAGNWFVYKNIDEIRVEHFPNTPDQVFIDDAVSILVSGGSILGSAERTLNVTNVTLTKPMRLSGLKITSSATTSPTIKVRASDITIEKCHIDAQNLNLPYNPSVVPDDTIIEQFHPTLPLNNLKIIDCLLENAGRDAIYFNSIGGTGNAVTNCRINGAYRNCISVISSNGTIISNCTQIQDWGLIAIDIEPNPLPNNETHNTIISSNIFVQNALSLGGSVNMRTASGSSPSTTDTVIVDGNICLGDINNTLEMSALRSTTFDFVTISNNIIKNYTTGISLAEGGVVEGNHITGTNSFPVSGFSSVGAIKSSGTIKDNVIEDYPYFGIIAQDDKVIINGNKINNVGFGVNNMSGIYIFASLGTFSALNVSANVISNCARGIYVRDSLNLEGTFLGNVFDSVINEFVSDESNLGPRHDETELKTKGNWNAGYLNMGGDYLWTDVNGGLRIKGSQPTSDFDGELLSGASSPPGALSSFTTSASVTSISATSTPVIINSTWSSNFASQFTGSTGGRITYLGSAKRFSISVSISATMVSGTDVSTAFTLYLNSAPISNTRTEGVLHSNGPRNLCIIWSEVLNTSDYLEVYVENVSNTTDIIVNNTTIRVD